MEKFESYFSKIQTLKSLKVGHQIAFFMQNSVLKVNSSLEDQAIWGYLLMTLKCIYFMYKDCGNHSFIAENFLNFRSKNTCNFTHKSVEGLEIRKPKKKKK